MTDTLAPEHRETTAVESPVVARKPRRRWARGVKRPEYLRPGDLDRLMIMLVALMAEVSAVRERLDTHEALSEQGESVTRAAVESWTPPSNQQAGREALRQGMLKRVLRAITEEREAALSGAEDGIADDPHAR